MNATVPLASPEAPANIVPAPIRKQAPRLKSRFSIVGFTNPRTGSKSWRVTGIKRDDGKPLHKRRVRENFSDESAAIARQLDLEREYHQAAPEEKALRATNLPDDQLRLAEAAFLQLGDEWPRLLDAVALWKNSDARRAAVDAPTIDDAVEQFKQWLDGPNCDLAEHTKSGYRIRVGMFANGVPNMRVSEITPATIRGHLEKREKAVGKTSVKNDRRAICRFLSWCVEKEWIAINPALGPRTKGGGKHKPLPRIFTVEQCEKLLRAAEAHKGGMLVPYVAVCLFAGPAARFGSGADHMVGSGS